MTYLRTPTFSFLAVLACAVLGFTGRLAAAPEPPAIPFTYQGYLTKEGVAITGNVLMGFKLYDGTNAAAKVISQATRTVNVAEGLFTASVDFGRSIPGRDPLWLELILIHPGNVVEVLVPRQSLGTVPTAVYASVADGLRPGAVLPENAVPLSALDVSDALTGGVLMFDGDEPVWGSSSSGTAGFWNLTGNADTDPEENFLGTLDFTPLELKVDNVRALRLEPASIPNIIAGHPDNFVSDEVVGASIGGGGGAFGAPDLSNWVTEDHGTIAGGQGNFIGGLFAAIGGGGFNTASGRASVVGGGGGFGEGDGPDENESGETLYANQARGDWSTVSGGRDNVARGTDSTIPGGRDNEAAGNFSFAAGRRAKATHNGSFVWGDSLNQDGVSQGANTFTARASGGTFFFSSTNNTGAHLAAGSGSWSSFSDRNAKTNVAPVDGKEVLARLARIPIGTWNYKSQDASVRHIGPMAQDFAAAFGVGENDASISNVDADGVALAAIQGLHELVKAKDAELAEMRERLAALEAALLRRNP